MPHMLPPRSTSDLPAPRGRSPQPGLALPSFSSAASHPLPPSHAPKGAGGKALPAAALVGQPLSALLERLLLADPCDLPPPDCRADILVAWPPTLPVGIAESVELRASVTLLAVTGLDVAAVAEAVAGCALAVRGEHVVAAERVAAAEASRGACARGGGVPRAERSAR
jgi:hypothetical protein